MKEILKLHIILDGIEEVRGKKGESCMILFHGNAEGPYFNGEILPGGVDTQKEFYGKPRSLSARYTLKGTDCEGKPCKLFIENNGDVGANGQVITKPILLTDSPVLQWVEEAELSGTLKGSPSEVEITIWQNQ